jgi:hypothetical protein
MLKDFIGLTPAQACALIQARGYHAEYHSETADEYAFLEISLPHGYSVGLQFDPQDRVEGYEFLDWN